MSKILSDADDPTGFEVPNNDWEKFPWETLTKEIDLIQSEIEKVAGIKLEKDDNVQDASFLEELRILNPSSFRSNGVVCITPDIAIRFSNFGKLYTIYSITDSLNKYPIEKIKDIINLHGWNYVDAVELDKPYNGKNLQLREANITWWIRYFDYL